MRTTSVLYCRLQWRWRAKRADLLIFTSSFALTNVCVYADLDYNGVVNVADLLIFTAMFGAPCN